VQRAYKYRLYPNNAQKTLFAKHFGCCRWIYNWALNRKIQTYQLTKKSIHRYKLNVELPKLKKAEDTAWLSEVNSQSLQQELIYLELAYARFFREKKGFPKFKSKHGHQSFGCPQGVKVGKSDISFPKIGSVKAVISRTFKGKIKTVTVSMTPTGKYFASVLVDDGKELPITKKYSEKTTVGIDLGLTHFATLSTGEKIANPRHLKQNLARLKREQRRLSRRVKGSNRRNKQRIKVARIHERVANIRQDFLHKLSTRLVSENQALAFETLNITGMLRNHKLARHIADAGWNTFVQFSAYKLLWNGKTMLRIGRFDPSSKLCDCGEINRELKLSDRAWTCGKCNRTHDRDIQAARNIKRLALHPKNFVPQDMREMLVEVGSSDR
jgi:putative transposase